MDKYDQTGGKTPCSQCGVEYPITAMHVQTGFITKALDRLPTAEIKQVTENKYLVEAEVYGQGIIMWILSQGKNIKLIEPVEMRVRIKEELIKILENYS